MNESARMGWAVCGAHVCSLSHLCETGGEEGRGPHFEPGLHLADGALEVQDLSLCARGHRGGRRKEGLMSGCGG